MDGVVERWINRVGGWSDRQEVDGKRDRVSKWIDG